MGGYTLPCNTIPPLAGWRIGVTAHRRADEQAELLRRRGATVVFGPVVRTHAVDNDRRLREATDALLTRPPDLVIATTGIGIRSWFGAVETWGLDGDLTTALSGARRVARGPKARAALAAVGLPSDFDHPSERLDRLVEHLVAEGVDGTRIALQLYGEEVPWAVDQLGQAGADVVAVPIYRWTLAEDLGPAQKLLRDMQGGQLDAVTFTSAAAVRSFASLADDMGIGDEVRTICSSSVVTACVGPITGEAAEAAGFQQRCAPHRGRLGLLVRALSTELHSRHRHFMIRERESVVHGGAVWSTDHDVMLSGLERMLFSLLAERPHAVVSRAMLRQRIWGPRPSDSAIDSALSRLRRVLRPVGFNVDAILRRGWTLGAHEVPCPMDPNDVDDRTALARRN